MLQLQFKTDIFIILCSSKLHSISTLNFFTIIYFVPVCRLKNDLQSVTLPVKDTVEARGQPKTLHDCENGRLWRGHYRRHDVGRGEPTVFARQQDCPAVMTTAALQGRCLAVSSPLIPVPFRRSFESVLYFVGMLLGIPGFFRKKRRGAS